MICPYCYLEAVWVENKEVYGRNFGKSFMIWLCRLCDAYVGCHRNTKKPLGTMANAEIRKLRSETHIVFDRLWRNKKVQYRNALYKEISKDFGYDVHIGASNIEQCNKIIEWSKNKEK